MDLIVQLVIICLGVPFYEASAEIREGSAKWEQDLSQSLKIGIAEGGYSKAVLECSADWMAFVVSMEEDFEGVVYVKGNFHRHNTPCFLNAAGGKDFALKIPYEQCGCKHNSELGGYAVTVVVQHEKDLITPGDLGFTLLCKDERNVNASLEGMRSRISLVDPDPGSKHDDGGELSAFSPSHIVTLTPPKLGIRPVREDL